MSIKLRTSTPIEVMEAIIEDINVLKLPSEALTEEEYRVMDGVIQDIEVRILEYKRMRMLAAHDHNVDHHTSVYNRGFIDKEELDARIEVSLDIVMKRSKEFVEQIEKLREEQIVEELVGGNISEKLIENNRHLFTSDVREKLSIANTLTSR